MNNKKVILLIFFLLAFGSYLYIYHSPPALKAKRNAESIKQVNVGMSKNDVVHIMGLPEGKRESFLNKEDSMYYYKPPFGASEGIYIQFDSVGIVNKIVDFE